MIIRAIMIRIIDENDSQMQQIKLIIKNNICLLRAMGC